MKIIILSFYSGLIDRGVETWAKNLKDKIQKKYIIEIVGGDKYGKSINWNIKSKLYWEWLIVRHLIDNFSVLLKADVIIPTNGSIQTSLCRIISFVLGKPMIVFGHAGIGRDDRWNLLCSPNVFVSFSDAQKRWALKYRLPWTRVVVIPHAVDTERFAPAKKKPRQKIVLCVAANIPSKRVNLVEKAVKKLKGYKFLAVGKGNPIEAAFAEMPKVYQRVDVFCFVPWEREAFGLVFLEALATNLPVVTIDDPVRREIVGRAGIFVKNPENANELSSVIRKAYEADWGEKPRKQAEKFAWGKIRIKYEKLFGSCCNN